MHQRIEKIDESHDRRILTMNSSTESQAYRRLFPAPMPSTHRFAYHWLDDMTLQLQTEELGIEEISARSDNFEKLSLVELRWLAEKHQAKLAKEALNEKDDRNALIRALRAVKQKPAQDDKEPAVNEPKAMIVPDEVKKLSDADLETRIAELDAMPQTWKKMSRAKREAWLAGVMAKQLDAVTV